MTYAEELILEEGRKGGTLRRTFDPDRQGISREAYRDWAQSLVGTRPRVRRQVFHGDRTMGNDAYDAPPHRRYDSISEYLENEGVMKDTKPMVCRCLDGSEITLYRQSKYIDKRDL